MLEQMRRLHPRGAANRGICVDADGAMLGPNNVLVQRTARGYRGIEREDAASLQRIILGDYREPDWLFSQSRRIAKALDAGEIALAQIYGLHIPINELNDRQLSRLSARRFAKTGFNLDEPRVPRGDPRGGEWTTDGDGGEGAAPPDSSAFDVLAVDADDGGGGDDEGGNDASSAGPSETTPGGTMPSATTPADSTTSAQERSSIEYKPDPNASFEMSPPDAADTDNPSAPPENPPVPSSPAASTSATGHENSQPSQSVPTDSPSGDKPPIDWTIAVPDEALTSTPQINALLRSIATWMGGAAAVLGAAYVLDPEVEVALAAVEGAAWLADYLPKIWSYLDAPKTLGELQIAIDDPRFGYEIHHIVEVQRRSDNPERNWLRFADRINSPENLVLIPYWKHVEISSWYSNRNDLHGNQTPREYLRGKSWQDQYDLGLEAMRLFGILK
jgi:hypothetical protein